MRSYEPTHSHRLLLAALSTGAVTALVLDFGAGAVSARPAGVATLAAEASNGTPASTLFKPVIGRPTVVPSRPLAGKPFRITFRVTRSDTNASLQRGRMICTPSIGNKVVSHTDSFRAGNARLSLVVPRNAAGKQLKVKVRIRAGAGSATRIATFRVLRPGPLPTLSVADDSAAEGNADTTALSFAVTLSASSTQTVSVHYTTIDGTATAPSDYAAASGSLIFRPGVKTRTVDVTVLGDVSVEQDETITLVLSRPLNAKIADGTGTGTIENDDVRSGHFSGSTSQGRSIAFDVTPDLSEVTNLVFYFEVTCAEGPIPIAYWWLGPGDPLPLGSDLSFGEKFTFYDSDLTGGGTFNGQFSAPGNASGTLQVDLALTVQGTTFHCSTGEVRWNAA